MLDDAICPGSRLPASGGTGGKGQLGVTGYKLPLGDNENVQKLTVTPRWWWFREFVKNHTSAWEYLTMFIRTWTDTSSYQEEWNSTSAWRMDPTGGRHAKWAVCTEGPTRCVRPCLWDPRCKEKPLWVSAALNVALWNSESSDLRTSYSSSFDDLWLLSKVLHMSEIVIFFHLIIIYSSHRSSFCCSLAKLIQWSVKLFHWNVNL